MNVAWGLCWGESVAENLKFFRVKWLRLAMEATSCVRRVRLRSFQPRSVPPLCSAMSGCSCVRASMPLLTLWLQIAVQWLHECCMEFFCCGESRSNPKQHYFHLVQIILYRKPCVFPCKVASAGDGSYLLRATGAAAVVSTAIGSSSVFCNEWLVMCAWFHAFVDSLVGDCIVMAASRLLGATAACVILSSLAAGHLKS